MKKNKKTQHKQEKQLRKNEITVKRVDRFLRIVFFFLKVLNSIIAILKDLFG